MVKIFSTSIFQSSQASAVPRGTVHHLQVAPRDRLNSPLSPQLPYRQNRVRRGPRYEPHSNA